MLISTCFNGIQYAATDFDAKCLVSIHDWGSMGRAQVFYEFDKYGKPTFFGLRIVLADVLNFDFIRGTVLIHVIPNSSGTSN